MAVKERKQITGTTAQINAYEGHEGQIVWDKDTKTLVGMSGTAGKNYPLAPKTYVDNEVAKVNTELQATNAEVAKKQPKGDYATNTKVTEGLAGKEDKGTCLPLTGGVVDGSLTIKDAFRLYANVDEKIGTITSEPIGGSFLDLFRKDAPSNAGCFALAARIWDPNGSSPDKISLLKGTPDGDLTWGDKDVDVIEAHSGNCLRYSSGLQICWGRKKLPPPVFSAVNWGNLADVSITLGFNFPLPFAEVPSTQVWCAYDIGNSIPFESWSASTTGIPAAWVWFPGAGEPEQFGAQYIAIGRWK